MLKYPVNMLYNRHKLDKYQNKIAERSLYKCEGKITPSVLNKKKKSRIYVDDTLDLHGMSIKDAYDVFFSFIQNAFLKQYKIVLIITGKGFKNQGKIRKCFFDWINYVEIREVILCCENDVFNDGAFYLTIKKSEKNAL